MCIESPLDYVQEDGFIHEPHARQVLRDSAACCYIARLDIVGKRMRYIVGTHFC